MHSIMFFAPLSICNIQLSRNMKDIQHQSCRHKKRSILFLSSLFPQSIHEENILHTIRFLQLTGSQKNTRSPTTEKKDMLIHGKAQGNLKNSRSYKLDKYIAIYKQLFNMFLQIFHQKLTGQKGIRLERWLDTSRQAVKMMQYTRVNNQQHSIYMGNS